MDTCIHYTFENFQRLPKTSEDSCNLTRHNRTYDDYCEILSGVDNVSLPEILDQLILKGKKIRILDCGAGSGFAIDDLLSGPYKNFIEKCVGISIHYFKNVSGLFNKYHNKIEWYLGSAEKILPVLKEKFDLILDVFGAYHYSEERSYLIEQYYRILNLNAQALIHHPYWDENILEFDEVKGNLEDYYIREHPSVFFASNSDNKSNFIVVKQCDEFPAKKLSLKCVTCYGLSIRTTNTLSASHCKNGNAWRPIKIIYQACVCLQNKSLKSADLENL